MKLAIAMLLAVFPSALWAQAAGDAVQVSVDWNDAGKTSETVPTTQYLANRLTLRSNPLNKPLLEDLRNLHTNDTRLQLWFSVPRQAVAELDEPTATQTSWDFQWMDPVVIDFFANTSGVRHLNIGTIPRWMFNLPPVKVPADPAASFYAYTWGSNGSLLKDPSGKQFADYQSRLFQWYTQGGFTDELGVYHASGHHFRIDYWGVLNEPNWENHLSVQDYTRLFDAVGKAIHKIDPQVQFFGPEVLNSAVDWERYFLDPKNHDPSAPPVQWFSLHDYVSANNDPASWQSQYFLGGGGTAQDMVGQLHEVIKIRDTLSPQTKIAIDEIGTFDLIHPEDAAGADEIYTAYNPLYWVATGAQWADNFITAEQAGISLISMTQMVGYATQSPSTSMINWDTAQPNAHYWVLKLIAGNFGPGDKLLPTRSSSPDVAAQASVVSSRRKLLLVNTSNRTIHVTMADAIPGPGLEADIVDGATGEQPPRRENLTSGEIVLSPFAVAVVSGPP